MHYVLGSSKSSEIPVAIKMSANGSANGDDGALADITNKVNAFQISEESRQRVRDHGYGEPTKFDYDTYNAGPKGQRPAGPAEAGEVDNGPLWGGTATKYEWSEDYGDVGPKDEALEKMLFHDPNQVEATEEIKKKKKPEELTANVLFESESKISPVSRFEDAGLHPVMLDNVQLCGYECPTPIQAYVLPSILKDKDIIGIAQTGSGKTAAFLIPTISKLMGKVKKLAAPRPLLGPGWTRDQAVRAEPLILVIAPTRELAIQIFDEARRLCYRSMLRPCVVYGGAESAPQMDELRRGCDVLIATPGRLQDFMQRQHLLSLSRVRYTIIDEADEMVSPDWADDLRGIMGGDSNDDDDHVYMMFSATFSKDARALAREYMASDHIRIRVGRAGSSHKNIQQKIIWVNEPDKRKCLFDLLMDMPPARTMIFVNNKRSADFVDDYLFNHGLPCTSIHADRTQREREDAIRAFKTAKAPILVTTGVSARGLDVKNVMHVINYDMPGSDYGGIDEYVHRIGRTARIGHTGRATSFYNDRNEDMAEKLVKLLVENEQEVPHFLEGYKPAENEPLRFDDDTDEEEGEGAGGDGTNGATGTTAAPAEDDGWN